MLLWVSHLQRGPVNQLFILQEWNGEHVFFDQDTTPTPPPTTTTATPLSTPPPTEGHDGGLDSSTVNYGVIVGAAFAVLVVVTFFLRYRVARGAHHAFLKRLRRRSAPEGQAVEVDLEMFQAPPDYATAVDMPRPCRCGAREDGTAALSGACSCRTPGTAAPPGGNEMEGNQAESPGRVCVIVVEPTFDIQMMPRNLNASMSELPTYDEYVAEFPETEPEVVVFDQHM